MKTKNFIYAAFAGIILASCSSNDFAGDQNLLENSGGGGAISFGFDVPTPTRAGGADAAAALGNQFIVWGEKNSAAEDTKDAPAAGHLVFPNYQVNYASNTAYTTTSNTKDWEYVGYTHSTNYQGNIKYKASASEAVNGSNAAQTIKYWDYGASSYTFTAVSASKLDGSSKTDIENGYITIQKNIDDGTSPYNKGYTIGVTANADLSKLYFSDRKIITATAGTNRNAPNTYGGNVTLTFRNALSQIRAGVYETISGYSISDIHFYVNTTGDSPTQTAEAKVLETDAFGALCPNIKGSNYAGTLTVTYSQEEATRNQPVVSASGTVNGNLILGTNTSTVTTSATLGETAAAPTWDTADGAYTTVMLQGAHTTNMKLKCDYTLYNSVSGETINVIGATAEVPYQYLQWKPNYKYTYLFKISKNTNGSSGQGVVGLYPITFDAVEIVAADGTAEYITTVSEPSITTFGVSAGKYVTGGNDYPASAAVYATVMDASVLATLSATNFSIYDVTTSDATNFPVTEASVAEALIEGPTWTAAQAALKKITCAAGPDLTFQNTVPAEDGTTITLHATDNKAATFTTTTGKKYALVYQKTAATYTVSGAQTFETEELFNAAGTLYTSSACTEVATWVNSTTEYYKRTAVSDKGNYIVKIVTVQ